MSSGGAPTVQAYAAFKPAAASSKPRTSASASGPSEKGAATSPVRPDASFSRGDMVEVSGLESEAGRALNGCRGEVLGFGADKGRYEVRFSAEKTVNVKPGNLRLFTRSPPRVASVGPSSTESSHTIHDFRIGDCVRACGLESEMGSKGLNGRDGCVMYVDTDRVEVRFALAEDTKFVKLKPCNLKKINPNVGPVFATRGKESKKPEIGSSTRLPRFSASASQSEPTNGDGPRPGDTVEVAGLSSDTGRQLNGQRGVVSRCGLENGRVEVRFVDEKLVSLKPGNLQTIKAKPQGPDIEFV